MQPATCPAPRPRWAWLLGRAIGRRQPAPQPPACRHASHVSTLVQKRRMAVLPIVQVHLAPTPQPWLGASMLAPVGSRWAPAACATPRAARHVSAWSGKPATHRSCRGWGWCSERDAKSEQESSAIWQRCAKQTHPAQAKRRWEDRGDHAQCAKPPFVKAFLKQEAASLQPATTSPPEASPVHIR